ncbi:UNVERIFIED_CONTAM: hypothetical protein HDU68_008948 [Siphonaria sp. JEL0065]|nr:hypothetical protein HDU68_008948 [Siphonaria sp. JEL0065]
MQSQFRFNTARDVLLLQIVTLLEPFAAGSKHVSGARWEQVADAVSQELLAVNPTPSVLLPVLTPHAARTRFRLLLSRFSLNSNSNSTSTATTNSDTIDNSDLDGDLDDHESSVSDHGLAHVTASGSASVSASGLYESANKPAKDLTDAALFLVRERDRLLADISGKINSLAASKPVEDHLLKYRSLAENVAVSKASKLQRQDDPHQQPPEQLQHHQLSTNFLHQQLSPILHPTFANDLLPQHLHAKPNQLTFPPPQQQQKPELQQHQQKQNQRTRYTVAQRLEAVARAREIGASNTAKEYGINKSLISRWIKSSESWVPSSSSKSDDASDQHPISREGDEYEQHEAETVRSPVRSSSFSKLKRNSVETPSSATVYPIDLHARRIRRKKNDARSPPPPIRELETGDSRTLIPRAKVKRAIYAAEESLLKDWVVGCRDRGMPATHQAIRLKMLQLVNGGGRELTSNEEPAELNHQQLELDDEDAHLPKVEPSSPSMETTQPKRDPKRRAQSFKASTPWLYAFLHRCNLTPGVDTCGKVSGVDFEIPKSVKMALEAGQSFHLVEQPISESAGTRRYANTATSVTPISTDASTSAAAAAAAATALYDESLYLENLSNFSGGSSGGVDDFQQLHHHHQEYHHQEYHHHHTLLFDSASPILPGTAPTTTAYLDVNGFGNKRLSRDEEEEQDNAFVNDMVSISDSEDGGEAMLSVEDGAAGAFDGLLETANRRSMDVGSCDGTGVGSAVGENGGMSLPGSPMPLSSLLEERLLGHGRFQGDDDGIDDDARDIFALT